jgi:hypothetical protein
LSCGPSVSFIRRPGDGGKLLILADSFGLNAAPFFGEYFSEVLQKRARHAGQVKHQKLSAGEASDPGDIMSEHQATSSRNAREEERVSENDTLRQENYGRNLRGPEKLREEIYSGRKFPPRVSLSPPG